MTERKNLSSLLCFSLLLLFSFFDAQATTFTVTNTNATGPGSLHQAVTDANADGSASAGSPHIVDCSGVTGTINLTSEIYLSNHITIEGPAQPGELILDGGGSIRPIRNNEGNRSNVQIIKRLTIQNGSSGNGGCILTSSSLTLEHCVVRGCNTGGHGGGIRNNNYAEADLTLNNCAIYGNTAPNGPGGGVICYGTCVFRNSTITGNSAQSGGGISAYTFSGHASLNIGNCIVSGNTSGGGNDIDQVGGTPVSSAGNNLIGSNADVAAIFPAGNPNGNGDIVGTSGAPIDPMFTANASPGSIAGDLSLQAGSPAIDMGAAGNIPAGITTDLAGNPRVADAGVDIGAFEYGVPAPVPTMGEWALIIFGLLVMSMGVISVMRWTAQQRRVVGA